MPLCLLPSATPLNVETAVSGLCVSQFIVVTPVNLFLVLVELVIPLCSADARLARELILRDMAACCCCCFTNVISLLCDCTPVASFFAELLPTKVPLVALITVLRSEEAARVGALSPSVVQEDATLNLYGIPSRSGRVTRMTTVFFSGGISSTVFCSASWSSETARRRRFARGGSFALLREVEVVVVLVDACRSLTI